jgi:V/A-type H+-transporting ATPase subunit C
MNNITVHGAASSKAHVLMGRLLKDSDYKKLMETKNIYEFIEYLTKNTNYKNVFLNPNEIKHREDIEIGMKKYLLKNYEKFYHYYHDNYRIFFKVLFMRYEVENIKLFIRAMNRNEDVRHLGDHLITSEVFTSIDYNQMIKSRNIQELIDALKGTIYYKLLMIYLNEESVKMQFYMEMSLDRIYFKKIKEIVSTFKGKDKELMNELLGKNSDLLNIQWIYRAKKFYDLSSEEILNYTLESGLKYDYKKLKEFCYLESIEELKESVLNTEYKVLFLEEEIFMERNMERFLFFLLEDLLKKGNNTIIVSLNYMHKLEYEVRDLFSILECIKYGFDNSDEYLVRVLK